MFDSYPHSIYASVLLKDNKIENWKVGQNPKTRPEEWTHYWRVDDDIKDFRCEVKEFVVNNSEEHNEVFEKLSEEWFKQWKISETYHDCLSEPYDSYDNLLQETLDKCQEFYDERAKRQGKAGVVWLKDDETGQLMVYTRGEYTDVLLNFISNL